MGGGGGGVRPAMNQTLPHAFSVEPLGPLSVLSGTWSVLTAADLCYLCKESMGIMLAGVCENC